jgi:2-oxoglutarate dehydrogenase E1 component
MTTRPETFLSGTSSTYAEHMYEQYQVDPNSVHPSWKKYFENFEQGLPFQETEFQNPSTAAAPKKVAVRIIIV